VIAYRNVLSGLTVERIVAAEFKPAPVGGRHGSHVVVGVKMLSDAS